MDLDKAVWEAGKAQEILDNPTFQWAWESITTEIKQQWQDSPARDTEGREKLWLMLQLAKKLQNLLTSTVQTGKMAQSEIAHKKTLLERARDALY